MKFFEIDGVIARRDDGDISEENMNDIVSTLCETLEEYGFEMCAIFGPTNAALDKTGYILPLAP